MAITALPVTFNGITYRSALEADWAATMTKFGWYFEYEAHPVLIDGNEIYLCDFRIPGQNVWAEAKGPHNERIDKTHRLYRAVREEAESPGGELVVILRAAGTHGAANWHHVIGHAFQVTINLCSICDQWCFTQPAVDHWFCRNCRTPDALIPDHQYISAVDAEKKVRELGSEAALRTCFGVHGRLMLTRAPRNGLKRAA